MSRKRNPSFNQRIRLLGRDGYRCRYCGVLVTNNTANMDHVTPFAAGGKTTSSNLVTCCRPCNKAKGNQLRWKPKPIGYYAPSVPGLSKGKIKVMEQAENIKRTKETNAMFKAHRELQRAIRLMGVPILSQ